MHSAGCLYIPTTYIAAEVSDLAVECVLTESWYTLLRSQWIRISREILRTYRIKARVSLKCLLSFFVTFNQTRMKIAAAGNPANCALVSIFFCALLLYNARLSKGISRCHCKSWRTRKSKRIWYQCVSLAFKFSQTWHSRKVGKKAGESTTALE